jgi:hypothetical protein
MKCSATAANEVSRWSRLLTLVLCPSCESRLTDFLPGEWSVADLLEFGLIEEPTVCGLCKGDGATLEAVQH